MSATYTFDVFSSLDGFGSAGPQQGRDRDQQRRQQGSRAKEGLHQGR